jgi:hypothetical protein
MSEIRYYFDESVELAVSQQLAVGAIDAVSAHSLERLGDSDPNHLARAHEMGRALCTYDQDFLRLAVEGVEHSGILFAQHQQASIGGWVRAVKSLHARMQSEDVVGRVVFLNM